MRFPTLLLAAAASFALVGCTRAAEDTAFNAKVHAYLLAHPEVIQEAVEKLQEKRQTEAEAQYKQSLDKGKAALPRFRQALERDPRDFVANAGGKVTVTEFYDYRCPHCINVAPKVVDLIKSNPDIRFVFKEMPIFGATSEHAARAAIAAKDPVRMARAMKHGVIAGRESYLAGRMPRRMYADPSSPLAGLI